VARSRPHADISGRAAVEASAAIASPRLNNGSGIGVTPQIMTSVAMARPHYIAVPRALASRPQS